MIGIKFQKRRNFSLLDVGMLIQSLMGDTFHPKYLTNQEYSVLDVYFIQEDKALSKTAKTGPKDIAKVMLNPARSPDHTDGSRLLFCIAPLIPCGTDNCLWPHF